ncbi:hypothetical protein V7103_21010 [Neobacillus drentensis]|uniref:hypothetical protein n=1 Tax=Neobacillus drentensis TaxID=220684 RepID=UPI0030000B15
MGWFGNAIRSVGRTIGKGVETVGRWTGNEKLEKAGRTLHGWCEEKSKVVARETSKTNEYNKELASIHDTKKINEILSSYSLGLQPQADLLEKNCINEVKMFFNEILTLLGESNEKGLQTSIRKLKKALKDIEKKVNGKIKKNLAKRISLDDIECLEILQLPSGPKKERQMLIFAKKVFSESLTMLSDEIKAVVIEQYDYLEEELQEKMDEIIAIAQKQHKEFKKIEELKNANEEEFEANKQKIEVAILACEYALENLEMAS